MLVGEKITLVPLEKNDLAKSRSWVNDVSLNSRMLRVLPVTQGEQERWYQDIVNDPSRIVFAIKTLKGKEHIGNTGLYHTDWIHRRAEFWILIGEQGFWKQGVGSDVVSLMQRYAFKSLNLNRLYLNVGVDNREAIALYKKLDFVEEGILREHYYIEGKFCDIVTMAILRNDYDAQE
ncbi:MAG: GNAT family N-acetyltransferase [Deltaproteobacteria bacterium]|nr:GNAT family N-acetyltransferase [Deltaproteobacteria bacterium]